MIDDYLVCCRDWGFPLSEAHGRVILWHGARDQVIPAADVRGLAALLPNSDIRIGPNDGHFFFARRIGEILPSLIERTRPESQRLRLAA